MSNDPIDIKILTKKIGELENWRAHAQVNITQLRNIIDALASRLMDLENRNNDDTSN